MTCVDTDSSTRPTVGILCYPSEELGEITCDCSLEGSTGEEGGDYRERSQRRQHDAIY